MTDLRARLPLARPTPSTTIPSETMATPLLLVVLAVVLALAAIDVGVATLLPSAVTRGVGVPGYELAAAPAQVSVLVALVVGMLGLRALRSASPGPARDAALHRVLVRTVRLVVPVAAVVATAPVAALPAGIRPTAALLPWCAAAGAGLAVTGALAVTLLALRAWFALVVGLVGALVVLAEAVSTGVELGPVLGATAVDGLARGTAVGALAGALLVGVVSLRRRPRRTGVTAAARRGLVYALVVVGVLALAQMAPHVWLVAVGVLVVGLAVPPLVAARVRAGVPLPDPPPPRPTPEAARLDPYATVMVAPRGTEQSALVPGLRMLHLVGDDPAAPGAGAEARRAAEIDRRLAAAGHRITVVCRRHRAAVDRTEHHGAGWVHWVHPGFGRGLIGRTFGYALAAGICARGSDADLVVEEFVAPFGSLAAPRWTARPVLGVVGWFDVDPRGRRLRHAVLRWAVRSHRSLVAVSVDVADAVAAACPRADVVVIGHGSTVPAGPVVPPSERSDDVVCTAPLHIAPKGLDVLLDAWSRVAADLPGRLVLTGAGPQDGALRARVHELGLDERVVLAGARCSVDPAAVLATARVAVVPSRYEASGVAALDALAVGTPVVAFDLPTLCEAVPLEGGVLVPRGEDAAADAAAFARALWALYGDDDRRARAAHWGPEIARAHDWDTLAGMQADVCRAVAGTRR